MKQNGIRNIMPRQGYEANIVPRMLQKVGCYTLGQLSVSICALPTPIARSPLLLHTPEAETTPQIESDCLLGMLLSDLSGMAK
jgi:hypothetical protein